MSRTSSEKIFQSKVMVVVLFLLFGWVLLEYTSLLYRTYQIEQKKAWFLEENERLVEQNSELEKRYEYYKTDYFFRKEAKRKLNKKEPGEQVMIVTGGDQVLAQQDALLTEASFLNKWHEYFFSTESAPMSLEFLDL